MFKANAQTCNRENTTEEYSKPYAFPQISQKKLTGHERALQTFYSVEVSGKITHKPTIPKKAVFQVCGREGWGGGDERIYHHLTEPTTHAKGRSSNYSNILSENIIET